MYKKYEVNESNFEIVLEKLQRIFNRHKVITMYKVNKDGEDGYKSNSFGIRRSYKEIKGKYITYPEFYCSCSYLKVTKHHFRNEYEEHLTGSSETLEHHVSLYNKMKCLIHINTGAGRALVIDEGDIVIFKPFGIVTIITFNVYLNENKQTKYFDTYIPIPFKTIDLKVENEKREQEEREFDEYTMKEFEKDFLGDFDDDWEQEEEQYLEDGWDYYA